MALASTEFLGIQANSGACTVSPSPQIAHHLIRWAIITHEAGIAEFVLPSKQTIS